MSFDTHQSSARSPAPEELDVRSLPHSGSHDIIFAKLDQLRPGGAFVILNDHDPKPLRYQTAGLWPGRFAWSYLEAGPLQWRVAITLPTETASHKTIDGLTRVLARACRLLAHARQPEEAGRLPADAWACSATPTLSKPKGWTASCTTSRSSLPCR